MVKKSTFTAFMGRGKYAAVVVIYFTTITTLFSQF